MYHKKTPCILHFWPCFCKLSASPVTCHADPWIEILHRYQCVIVLSQISMILEKIIGERLKDKILKPSKVKGALCIYFRVYVCLCGGYTHFLTSEPIFLVDWYWDWKDYMPLLVENKVFLFFFLLKEEGPLLFQSFLFNVTLTLIRVFMACDLLF